MNKREELAGKIIRQMKLSKGFTGVAITAPKGIGKTNFLSNELSHVLDEDQSFNVLNIDLALSKSSLEQQMIEALKPCKQINLAILSKDKIDLIRSCLDELIQQKPVLLIIDHLDSKTIDDNDKEIIQLLNDLRLKQNQTDLSFRLLVTARCTKRVESLFAGIAVAPLPRLGQAYLQKVLDDCSLEHKPSLETIKQAFDLCEHRPDCLNAVINRLELDVISPVETIEQRLLAQAEHEGSKEKRAYEAMKQKLPILQQAVLTVLNDEPDIAPYSNEAMVKYRTLCKRLDKQKKKQTNITKSSVEYALKALKVKGLMD